MIISVVLNWRQNCQTLISSMMSPSKRFFLILKIWKYVIDWNLKGVSKLDQTYVAARNFLVFFFLVFFPRTNIMSKVANKGNKTATFIFVLSVRYCQKPPWIAWVSESCLSCICSGTGSMDITTYKFAFADKNNK